MKPETSRERERRHDERTELLEFFDVTSDMRGKYSVNVGEKIFFKYDRTFEEFQTGKRILLKAGSCAYVTNRYTLLIGDREAYLTEDMFVCDISYGGIMQLIRDELYKGKDDKDLSYEEKSKNAEFLRAVENVFKKLSIKNI